jgi:Protein of unknown function (DUF3383).
MPYLDKVVDVTVNLGTQPIDTVGFETPLFIAIHNNFTERARVYAELDQMVEDGFAQGSAAYEFAAKAFGGVFPPQYVMIGRQAKEKTTVDFKGIAAAADTDVVMTIAKGSYNTSLIVPISGGTAATQIAEAMKEKIETDGSLDGITVQAEEGVITITGDCTVGYHTGNYTIKNIANAEKPSTVVDKINAERDNWYFLCHEDHTDIEACAKWAQANYKLHVYSTAEDVTGKDNNIATKLKAAQYDSVGMYDPRADKDFPEGGIIGAMASNDPSYGDSLHLKQMPGVIAPSLTLTQRMAIWENHVNFYRMINGVGAFWEGKCASGQYADAIRFAHWIKFRSEESMFGYMHRRSNMGLSMKMSDDDLPVIKSVLMNNPINTGIKNGAILTGFDEDNNVFYDPIITVPKRAEIPTNQLAARVLEGVKVELVYNNALHFVRIRINVLLDKVGSKSTNAVAMTE